MASPFPGLTIPIIILRLSRSVKVPFEARHRRSGEARSGRRCGKTAVLLHRFRTVEPQVIQLRRPSAPPKGHPRHDLRPSRLPPNHTTLLIMTAHDDTAQTWRDVAERLSAAQIAQLERLERDEPQALLAMARQWATKNMTTGMPFDDVAPPAGAVRTFDWQLDSTWFRDFEGTARRGGPARVQIYGRQQADGSTRRWIAVHTRHLDAMDATTARELGSALTEAADEMERLS